MERSFPHERNQSPPPDRQGSDIGKLIEETLAEGESQGMLRGSAADKPLDLDTFAPVRFQRPAAEKKSAQEVSRETPPEKTAEPAPSRLELDPKHLAALEKLKHQKTAANELAIARQHLIIGQGDVDQESNALVEQLAQEVAGADADHKKLQDLVIRHRAMMKMLIQEALGAEGSPYHSPEEAVVMVREKMEKAWGGKTEDAAAPEAEAAQLDLAAYATEYAALAKMTDLQERDRGGVNFLRQMAAETLAANPDDPRVQSMVDQLKALLDNWYKIHIAKPDNVVAQLASVMNQKAATMKKTRRFPGQKAA